MASFDYIIVGAGAAGCALAARLATGLPHQHILLVDAGGENNDQKHQSFGERHWTLAVPGYNWGYKTVPQDELDAREIDYSRGKGLGGSTAINFCLYTRGPSADYDHWAELVGDEIWSWKNSRLAFNKAWPVKVSVAEAWDHTFGDFMRRAYHYQPKNLDHNSGNPIGISVCQLAAHNGKRVTAAGAFLASPPSNLKIMTRTPVTKLVSQGKKIIGVETMGRQLHARKEVILSAGAIDSPKLLLLSGIGPGQDLRALDIPVVQDLPGVGNNLQDRLFLELVTVQEQGSHHRTSYIDSPAALEQAREEWLKNRSGPLSDYYLPQMIAYQKSERILASEEFEKLDSQTQRLLQEGSKPQYEIVSQNPSPSVKAPEKYLATAVAFQGNHGTGSVKLCSSNASDAPVINPKFLAHPFDKRTAIESVRETLKFLNQPLMAEGSIRFAAGPEGGSDEEILAYIRKFAISMWHSCGTVKMGMPEEIGTCVDNTFRVIGMEGLRVVDMSVAPFLPSAYLQAVAYLVGETAAKKILDEERRE